MLTPRSMRVVVAFASLLGTTLSPGQEAFELRGVPSERVTVAQAAYFPKMAILKNGDILASFKTGAAHVGKTGRAAIARSTDGGRTWSAPVTIFDIPDADDGIDLLSQLRDGTVLAAAVSYTWEGEWIGDKRGFRADTYVLLSKDNGVTWSRPAKADTRPYDWAYPFGRIVELPDGTLLMPGYGGYFPFGTDAGKPPEKQGETSFVVRSRDGGRTWGEPSPIAQRCNELTVIRRASGKLLAALRSSEKGAFTAFSTSPDDGRTWSTPAKVLEDREHPTDLLTLKDGRLLATFGVRHKPYGVQAALLRERQGAWVPERRFLLASDGDHGDLGYPVSVERVDGKIVTVYYIVYGERDPTGAKGIAPNNAFTKAVIWELPRD
jgi:Neuraminidase (sialidase)